MRNTFFSVALSCTALVFSGCATTQQQPAPPPAAAAQPAGAPSVQTAAPALSQAEIEAQFLRLVNQARQQNGLKPLTVSAELDRSSQSHSATMASGQFLSIKGSNELPLSDRFAQFGVRSDSVGENVLSIPAPDSRLADDGLTTWMAKDASRRNILSPRFERTGFGIVHSSGPVGETYVTEDFAR